MKHAIVHIALAGLLAAGFTATHARSESAQTATPAATGAQKASSAAQGKKKARKPASQASNPGTSGGAGNRSGGEAKDGASFEAPRAGKGASKPTGTGWD